MRRSLQQENRTTPTVCSENRMVHIGSAQAFCKDGTAAVYQKNTAKAYITIEMEEAVRLLDTERAAG